MQILTKKNFIIFGMVAFLIMSMWTLFFMSFDMEGKMINCPFMDDSSSICNMTFAEHMNDWQRSFTATPHKNSLLSLFLLLVVVQCMGIILGITLLNQMSGSQIRPYFYRHRPEIKLFDTLALALSQGIIQPKIYA